MTWLPTYSLFNRNYTFLSKSACQTDEKMIQSSKIYCSKWPLHCSQHYWNALERSPEIKTVYKAAAMALTLGLDNVAYFSTRYRKTGKKTMFNTEIHIWKVDLGRFSLESPVKKTANNFSPFSWFLSAQTEQFFLFFWSGKSRILMLCAMSSSTQCRDIAMPPKCFSKEIIRCAIRLRRIFFLPGGWF